MVLNMADRIQPNLGLIGGNSALVAANDVAAAIMRSVQHLQPTMGDLIQDCSGAIDNVEITAALAAASNVALSEGIFSISAPILIPSNTWVKGAGREVTRLELDADVASIFYTSLAEQTEYMALSDLTLEGNKAARTSGSGIVMDRSRRCYIFNLLVKDFFTDGIQYTVLTALTAGASDVIQRCYFQDMGNDGIYIGQYAYNKQINLCAFDNAYNHCIECDGGGAAIIQNEIGVATNDSTLLISSGAATVRVIGNTIESDGGSAIEMMGDRHIVTNNRLYNQQASGGTIYGIYMNWAVDDNVIAQNVIRCSTVDVFVAGIYLKFAVDNIVQSNRIRNTATAILGTNNSTGNMIKDNIVSNNTATINVEAGNYIQDNTGYVTENYGTDSIASGTTSKQVAHGCDDTPTKINIEFREQATNDYGRWWISGIDGTNFTLNVTADPGSNLDFAWEALVR